MEMSTVIAARPGHPRTLPGRDAPRRSLEPVAMVEPAAIAYVRGNIRVHVAARLRRFDLSAAVARAVGDCNRVRPCRTPVETDILATLDAVGDPRLVRRAIAALVASNASIAAPGTHMSCRLTLTGDDATLVVETAADAGSGEAEPRQPPAREPAMSAPSARLVIEEHGGSVRSRIGRGGRAELEIRIPAFLS